MTRIEGRSYKELAQLWRIDTSDVLGTPEERDAETKMRIKRYIVGHYNMSEGKLNASVKTDMVHFLKAIEEQIKNFDNHLINESGLKRLLATDKDTEFMVFFILHLDAMDEVK